MDISLLFFSCLQVTNSDILSYSLTFKGNTGQPSRIHTLTKVVGNLYHTFVLQLKQRWVLVVGDAKTYDLLQSVCVEYGHHLKWLLPFPGDWHVLFNYQKNEGL